MPDTLRFKHARFSTRLPVGHLFTPSHYWLKRDEATGFWRVGFTKFATRMLGELVLCEWKVDIGEMVESGQVIGHVEGFKALSDVFSAGVGTFQGGNPVLEEDACVIRSGPYEHWLYQIDGEPEIGAMAVEDYADLLKSTITEMHELEKSGEAAWDVGG